MAKAARERGEDTFCHRPLEPNGWTGSLVESEPIYRYECPAFTLTEEEYKDLFEPKAWIRPSPTCFITGAESWECPECGNVVPRRRYMNEIMRYCNQCGAHLK